MTPYIMDGEREAERLILKTDLELVRRHLAWSGLGVGESFVDVGCGTGEVVVAACEVNGGARPWHRCRRAPSRARARRLPPLRTDRSPVSRRANRRPRLIGTRGRSI